MMRSRSAEAIHVGPLGANCCMENRSAMGFHFMDQGDKARTTTFNTCRYITGSQL
jgi:hypothetical protein